MTRRWKTVLNKLKSAALALAMAGVLAQAGGCFLLHVFDAKPDKPEIDLFDPETAKAMIKEPVIIPGLVLFLEITAGGMPIVPGGAKLVSLRNDITVPIIGEVDCTGLTLAKLSEKLKGVFEEFYRNPSVTVSFAEGGGGGPSPWGTVGVYGQVQREGHVNLPATSQLSLTLAIQQAGGFTLLANRKQIHITRKATQKELPQLKVEKITQTVIINYNEISSGQSPDPHLLKDDVVFVKETWL